MNLERGFRRATLAVSVAAFCAGLGLTAYDPYATVEFTSALKRLRSQRYSKPPSTTNEPKSGHIGGTTLTLEDFDREPEPPKPLLVLVSCVILSVGSAAVPWSLFYFVRWIVRGFQ